VRILAVEERVTRIPVIVPKPSLGVLAGYGEIVLLNSPLAFPGYLTYCEEISIDEAKYILDYALDNKIPIKNYIGHPATCEVVNRYVLGQRLLEPNREMYQPSTASFIALVFRLKKRLARPEEVEQVKPEDLQVLLLSAIRWIG